MYKSYKSKIFYRSNDKDSLFRILMSSILSDEEKRLFMSYANPYSTPVGIELDYKVRKVYAMIITWKEFWEDV